MDIRYEMDTGWPGSLNLHQRIAAYVRPERARRFKVGITNNPTVRAANYGDQYDEMIVVYKTASDNNLRDMEEFLTRYFEGDSDNLNYGGGGPRGDGPYFLYVVLHR